MKQFADYYRSLEFVQLTTAQIQESENKGLPIGQLSTGQLEGLTTDLFFELALPILPPNQQVESMGGKAFFMQNPLDSKNTGIVNQNP